MKLFKNVVAIRGECGHRHNTIKGAARCQRQEDRICKRQGGYSDRTLRVRDELHRWRDANDDEYFEFNKQAGVID